MGTIALNEQMMMVFSIESTHDTLDKGNHKFRTASLFALED